MKKDLNRLALASLLAFCLAFGACSSVHRNRTHRPDLLNDKVTAERAQQALKSAGPAFSDVTVAVTNGVVVLTGSVPSADARSRAESVLRDLNRPERVRNELQIQSSK